MDATTPATPTVRAAHARLAALRRHHPGDEATIVPPGAISTWPAPPR